MFPVPFTKPSVRFVSWLLTRAVRRPVYVPRNSEVAQGLKQTYTALSRASLFSGPSELSRHRRSQRLPIRVAEIYIGLVSLAFLALLLPRTVLAQSAPEVVFTVDVGKLCGGGTKAVLINPPSWNCPSSGDTGKVAGEAKLYGTTSEGRLQTTISALIDAYGGGSSAYGLKVPISIYARTDAPYTVAIDGDADVAYEGRNITVISNTTFSFQLDEWRTALTSSPSLPSGSRHESTALTTTRTGTTAKTFTDWPGVTYVRLAIVTVAASISGGSKGSKGRAATTLAIDVKGPPSTGPTLTLVDPPLWLRTSRGSGIVNDPLVLRIGGRPVTRIAADGVTQLLVRVNGATPRKKYAISVVDETGARPSMSRRTVGDFAVPGGSGYSSAKLIKGDADGWAFAVFRAPTDFVRTASDQSATERHVTIRLTADGSEIATQVVTLIRTPVVLVHGLWDTGKDTWRGYGDLSKDPRFKVWKANYGELVGPSIATVTPDYVEDTKNSARESALGFAYGARQVYDQIQAMLNGYRDFEDVAVTQVDVVAHSMGGDVTRTMVSIDGFFGDENYGKGLVHKVVTVATPHLGSPLATALLDPANKCMARLFSRHGFHVFATVSMAGWSGTGGVNDLRGDGKGGGLSDALARIASPPVGGPPLLVATIAGELDNDQLAGIGFPSAAWFFNSWLLCPFDPAADLINPDDFPTLIGGASDGIVPLTSALAGRNRKRGIVVKGTHSPGTQDLGFKPPNVLESYVLPNVIKLLETPTYDTSRYRPVSY